jgi:hypothetical protein
MRKILGWMMLAVGSSMLIAPQSLMGLKELQWMFRYSFNGEVPLGIFVIATAYYFLDLRPAQIRKDKLTNDSRGL